MNNTPNPRPQRPHADKDRGDAAFPRAMITHTPRPLTPEQATQEREAIFEMLDDVNSELSKEPQ